MSESRITTEFPHSSSLGLFDESIYFSPFKMSHFQVFFLIFPTFEFSRPKWIKVHLCRLLFAIVAKWSINAHLGKWWEENNDDFLLANVSTHVRKEGKKLGKKQVEGIRYHGIQRTFDFYAVVSNACKYDRSSRRKKIYFLFSPLLFVGKRKVSVFDLYSISRIKRTNTRAQALLPGKQKKSRKCHGVDMYVIFSSPQKLKILGCKVSICSTFSLPRRQGGLLWLLLLSYS